MLDGISPDPPEESRSHSSFQVLGSTTLHARPVSVIVAFCLEEVLRDWCLSAVTELHTYIAHG